MREFLMELAVLFFLSLMAAFLLVWFFNSFIGGLHSLGDQGASFSR